MSLPVITLKHIEYNSKKCIGLYFNYDMALVSRLQKLDIFLWNHKLICWYAENNIENLRILFSTFRGVAWLDGTLFFGRKNQPKESTKYRKPELNLNTASKDSLDKFARYLKRSRYRESTICNYLSLLKRFLSAFSEKLPEEINNDDIIEYCNEYIIKSQYSAR